MYSQSVPQHWQSLDMPAECVELLLFALFSSLGNHNIHTREKTQKNEREHTQTHTYESYQTRSPFRLKT